LTIVDETDQEICLELLQKQRLYLRELNKNPEMDEEAIRKFQDLLDVEEERLRLKFEQV
jgi:hypothetical protein